MIPDALRDALVRNAGILAAGNFLAHGLALVGLILMARFWSQDAVGLFTVFLAYASMVNAVSLLSYHLGIPNVRDARQLAALLRALLIVAAAASAAVGGAFALAGYRFAWPLALYTLVRSLFVLADQVQIREQSFRPVFWARVCAGLALILILLAWIRHPSGAGDLVGAQLVAVCLVIGPYAYLSLAPRLAGAQAFQRQGWAAAWEMLKRERRFSLYVTPSQLFNLMAYQLPTIVIESAFDAALAAQYAVTLRFCFTPINLVAGAVGQTYHGRLAHTVREAQPGGLRDFRRLTRGLAVLAAAAGLGIVFVLPWIMNWALGPGWEFAARIVVLMSPMYTIMFLVAPLTVSYFVFERQQALFWVQLAYLLISLASFGIGALRQDLVLAIGLFSGLAFLRYVWIYLDIRRMTRSRLR